MPAGCHRSGAAAQWQHGGMHISPIARALGDRLPVRPTGLQRGRVANQLPGPRCWSCRAQAGVRAGRAGRFRHCVPVGRVSGGAHLRHQPLLHGGGAVLSRVPRAPVHRRAPSTAATARTRPGGCRRQRRAEPRSHSAGAGAWLPGGSRSRADQIRSDQFRSIGQIRSDGSDRQIGSAIGTDRVRPMRRSAQCVRRPPGSHRSVLSTPLIEMTGQPQGADFTVWQCCAHAADCGCSR